VRFVAPVDGRDEQARPAAVLALVEPVGDEGDALAVRRDGDVSQFRVLVDVLGGRVTRAATKYSGAEDTFSGADNATPGRRRPFVPGGVQIRTVQWVRFCRLTGRVLAD
jgi:hypothetical protein